MASVTRVNPTAVALGTLQSTLQLKIFKVVLSNSGDATDRTAAQMASLTDEIGTTGALMQGKANGRELAFIGDGHALDVDTVAIRLGRILDSTTGSLTASGVYTCGGGGTVTVTNPTTFVGLQT
jgi:hypothetical protein